METTRQNKISRLLQKELGEIFLLQTKAMPRCTGISKCCTYQSRHEYSSVYILVSSLLKRVKKW